MGTHPIFESDFDCLTERMADVITWLPTFYINWASPVARSVMVVASELNLLGSACVKEIDVTKKEQKSERYLKLNPNGTVPTYACGEIIITESRDIACHIAKGTCLYPDDERKRKIDELLIYDSQIIWPALLKIMVPLIKDRTGPAPEEERVDIHNAMCHINSVLGKNDFLTGATPTIADIFIFNNFWQPSFDSTFEYPSNVDALKAWKNRMQS